jgi:hypothetical protein
MLPTFQQAADADVHDTPPVCGPRRRFWGAAYSYEKVREQARIQVQGRSQGQVIYETLPVAPGFGLCFLPTERAFC